MNPVIGKLEARMLSANTLVCVGLDPEFDLLPEEFRSAADPLFAFNRCIIDGTAEFAAAYKPNSAFYEAHGAHGVAQLQQTLEYIRTQYPGIVTVLDAKRGDNANTNRGYARFAFDLMNADAVTLHTYLGEEANEPFLERRDRVCIFLCRTSNAGAADVQDLQVNGAPLWKRIAEKVTGEWDRNGNTMLVVGATYPDEMRTLRSIAPRTTFLVPGAGAQGGDIEAVVNAGLDARGLGLLISSSRGITGAASPALAARALRDEINHAREALHAAR